jgi:acyl-CoA synthetase (AMP-forming)/AMP-acid ligase II
MVTHANAMANAEMLGQAWGYPWGQSSVSWAPLFHDMGLIVNMLMAVYLGGESIMFSPTAFVQRPIRWLQAVSRSGAQRSGGPNFAYDLCVRKIALEECGDLDLSNWRIAYNGAEPVRHETLKRFARTFAPFGFCEDAFWPGYGLAEATALVSARVMTTPPKYLSVRSAALEAHRVEPAGPDERDARMLVGCGTTWLDCQVRVVNPETKEECPPDEVGEIWVSSPSVAQGYWNMEEATEATFTGRITGTNEGPFLRTGDLGFLHEDELFITGRIKDLIIVFGANHYPQDIELTVERSHPSLRPGRGVAFSVEGDEGEELVVVQEAAERFIPDLDVEEVRKAITAAVSAEHDLRVHDVVLAKPGTVQKTSSGKLMRRACRALYLDDAIERLEPRS